MRPNSLALILLLAAAACFPSNIHAAMQPMSDAQLSSLDAAAGISIGLSDVAAYYYSDGWTYTAPDGGSLSLNSVVLSNGQGGPFSLNVGAVDANGNGLMEPLTMDVGSVYGNATFSMVAPDWSQSLSLDVGSVSFCGQSLGSLSVGPLDLSSYALYLSPPDAGTGIDFELDSRLDIGALNLAYNTTTGAAFTLSGIHLSQTATGAPEDPSTWSFSGMFQLGDLSTSNPATFNVGSDPTSPNTVIVQVQLPAAGNIRINDVKMDNSDFGPVAIDGIDIHRMTLKLTP